MLESGGHRRFSQLVVVVCPEHSRRHMPEGFEQPPVVVPEHPLEGAESRALPSVPTFNETAEADDCSLQAVRALSGDLGTPRCIDVFDDSGYIRRAYLTAAVPARRHVFTDAFAP